MNTKPTLAERTPHIPLAVLRELWRDARFRYRNYPADQSDLFRMYVHDELQQTRIVELEVALAASPHWQPVPGTVIWEIAHGVTVRIVDGMVDGLSDDTGYRLCKVVEP